MRCSPTTATREIQQALARCGQPPAAELETQIALAKSRLLGPDALRERAAATRRQR